MEEEKRLPRNIRQIGEKEENVRVYLEDYVYTFIRKLETDRESRAGILLGSRETVEGVRCFFIKGGVELEGLIGENGVCFSEDTWKTVEEEIGRYFSDCSICGWFIRGNEENCPDKEMLKRVHSQVFAGENCLMYWKEEENDCFWMEDEKKLRRLRGYYVYYERNFQMQNYMLSCKERPVSEIVDDQAAKNFRKIMKTKQHERKAGQSIWTQAGTVAAAAIIFVGTIYLIGKATTGQNDENQVPAFAVGASVERQSGENGMPADESEENDRAAEDSPSESDREAAAFEADQANDQTEEESGKAPLEVEMPTLRLYMNESEGAEPFGKGQTDEAASGKTEASAGDQISGKTEAPAGDQVSGKTEAPAGDQVSGKTEAPAENQMVDANTTAAPAESNTQEIQGADQETETAALEAQASVGGRKYVIQPGDTLADISIRFYGSTDMIMQICSANQISNPNTIFIGQEIELP